MHRKPSKEGLPICQQGVIFILALWLASSIYGYGKVCILQMESQTAMLSQTSPSKQSGMSGFQIS